MDGRDKPGHDERQGFRHGQISQATSLAAIPGALVLVGAGKMGGAMLDGWLARKLPPKKIVVLEPQPSKAIKALARRGVRINPKGGIGKVAALVIAVKPQTAPDALPLLAALIGKALWWSRSWPGARSASSKSICRSRDRSRHAEHAGGHRPRHHRRGRQCARHAQRRASSRMTCSPPPARSNGSTTKR